MHHKDLLYIKKVPFNRLQGNIIFTISEQNNAIFLAYPVDFYYFPHNFVGKMQGRFHVWENCFILEKKTKTNKAADKNKKWLT